MSESRNDSAWIARAGLRTELGARLVQGRVVQIGSLRPAGFSCETTGTMSIILIITSASEHNGRALAVFGQVPTHPTEWGDDPDSGSGRMSSAVFVMKEDFFTPGQERQAWNIAGAITLALFKAWVGRGN
jgi:hypothetical protein